MCKDVRIGASSWLIGAERQVDKSSITVYATKNRLNNLHITVVSSLVLQTNFIRNYCTASDTKSLNNGKGQEPQAH